MNDSPEETAEGVSSSDVDTTADRGGLPDSARLVLVVVAIALLGVWGGWALLLIVGAILVSIVMHELGHYLVAKWSGMKVTEFFVGFGPRLWSYRKGETEYGLKAIPAGAYVRIIGMHNLEEVASEDESRSYRAKSYPKRLAVVLAGPAMNLLIGFVLLLVVFAGFGSPREDRWTVGRVLEGSAADAAGVREGDRLVSIAGEPVDTFDTMGFLIEPHAGQPIDIVVERDGNTETLNTTLGWRLAAHAAFLISPLESGDEIVSVNGEEVTTYDQFSRMLSEAPEGTVTVEFERHGYPYTAPVAVPVELPADGFSGFLGIGPHIPRVRETPAGAVAQSGRVFGGLVATSIEGIGRFFSPSGLGRFAETVFSTPPTGTNEQADVTGTEIKPIDSSSPAIRSDSDDSMNEDRVLSILGVIRLGSQAAGGGAVTFIFLLLTVNIFLALINLIPLLPFDGGHAAVATYEAIVGAVKRKPYRVNMARLMPITYAVVFLLVGIGLSSMYLDIVSPAQNPFAP